MRWQTETHIPDFPFTIEHNSQLLLLGSCFTENIGSRLGYYKFNTVQNPFGIVYNPLSLLENVRILTSAKTFTNTDLAFANGRFFSYDHHSRFSAANAEQSLQLINDSLADARAKLSHAKVVFISLGTAFYWWLKTDERIVNNCHKQPSKLFEQRRASVKEVRSALTEVIVLLQKAAPTIEVVFTISPIRHLKHGSAGNQLSKATLMVAAQELAEGMNKVHYFPSYELLLDDLRDYRWYEEDLIHPNKMAVDYIWQKFEDAFFNVDTKDLLPKIDAIQKQLNHRFFEHDQSSFNSILQTLEKRIQETNLDFTNELEKWKSAWLNRP